MYFTANTYTKEQLAAEYKRLAKKLHPDVVGGSEAAFKAMKSEYDEIDNKMFNGVWNRPQRVKTMERTNFIKRTETDFVSKNPPTEITPEDIQKGFELLSELFKLFKK